MSKETVSIVLETSERKLIDEYIRNQWPGMAPSRSQVIAEALNDWFIKKGLRAEMPSIDDPGITGFSVQMDGNLLRSDVRKD